MTAVGYTLEHFYYGQFVRQGKPEGELRLLASSAGIKQDDVPDIVRSALLPPMSGQPAGAWGVVRGKTVPFIVAQSQLTPSGAAMLHCAVVPTDALRSLSGNLNVIARHLLQRQMPEYDRLGDRLLPIVLPDAGPPSETAQTDSMLSLMTAAKDRLDVVEWLLSAIVKGVQVIVINAPNDPVKRLSFVEGLLALIPPPARFGVTFALHTLPSTRVDAQIIFTTAKTAPENVLVYDWSEGNVSGNVVEDEYSRFMVSQLRLDAMLVLEQTSALTPIAAWRIKRGDTLAEALGYAGYRLSIDNALVNHLPVPVEEAATVLTQDPTLSDDLRASYARHIMAFALALEDMSYAQPLALMLRQDQDLERVALVQLTDVLQSGKSSVVYKAINAWLLDPLGPKGMEWVALAQAAALAHLASMARAGNAAGLRAFLDDLMHADPLLQIETIIPKVIEVSSPIMARDAALAEQLVVLAAQYVPGDQFLKMFQQPGLAERLPEAAAKFASHLRGTEATPLPSGLMARAVSAFEEQWAPLLLIRFTELALLAKRVDMIDATALSGLVRAAGSEFASAHDPIFKWVVQNLSTDESIATLDEASPRYLLQLLLARHLYADLANELQRHLRVLYPSTDRQNDFAVMVRRLFADTPMEPDQLAEALRSLEAGGVKPLPLAMAHFGALKRSNWSSALNNVATNLTTLLFNNRATVEGIPPGSLMELLDYHVKRQDDTESIRVAGLLPAVAATKGEGGVAMMAQMYKMLNWDKTTRTAAVEILRRYIRHTDKAFAWQAVVRLTEALGERFAPIFEATFALRQILDGEDLPSYAMLLHLTARLLRDTTVVYVEKRGMPTLKTLTGDLDSLVGGLSDDDRQALAASMLNLGRAIDQLGKQQKANRPRDMRDFDAHVTQVMEGKARPLSALDVLRVFGGYFMHGKRLEMKLQQSTSFHPFGDRAAPSLLWETQVAVRVLRSVLQAFPPEHDINLTADVLQAEMESLWGDLPLNERKRLVRNLAGDFQRVPELVTHIYESGDPKVLDEAGGTGKKLDQNKQRPENTLELYRFVHGYFKARTRNRS